MIKGKIKMLIITVAAVAAIAVLFSGVFACLIRVNYPIKYSEYVEKYCAEFGVDQMLVYAVIKTESSFDPSAVSGAGAQGLMQITPETLEWLAGKLGEEYEKLDIFNEETAIKYGTFFLSYLLDEFGNRNTAVAAYHAGRGRINDWLSDPAYSADGRTLIEIPIDETRHYVNKINSAYNVYTRLYEQKG